VASHLERIRTELTDALDRACQIAGGVDDNGWSARPAPDQWSVAECLTHLSLTSQAFLPLIDAALGGDRGPGGATTTRCRMDLTGRLLWLAMTINVPVKTTERFVPRGPQPRASALSEFGALQAELIDRVARSQGLDLGARRIVSPFDGRLRYNLCSCFRIIAAHQRQHLKQAERVIAALRR
jgi:hypothetical protein